jgi:hypothetical protein
VVQLSKAATPMDCASWVSRQGTFIGKVFFQQFKIVLRGLWELVCICLENEFILNCSVHSKAN